MGNLPVQWWHRLPKLWSWTLTWDSPRPMAGSCLPCPWEKKRTWIIWLKVRRIRNKVKVPCWKAGKWWKEIPAAEGNPRGSAGQEKWCGVLSHVETTASLIPTSFAGFYLFFFFFVFSALGHVPGRMITEYVTAREIISIIVGWQGNKHSNYNSGVDPHISAFNWHWIVSQRWCFIFNFQCENDTDSFIHILGFFYCCGWEPVSIVFEGEPMCTTRIDKIHCTSSC